MIISKLHKIFIYGSSHEYQQESKNERQRQQDNLNELFVFSFCYLDVFLEALAPSVRYFLIGIFLLFLVGKKFFSDFCTRSAIRADSVRFFPYFFDWNSPAMVHVRNLLVAVFLRHLFGGLSFGILRHLTA